jgi:hypothetical protein
MSGGALNYIYSRIEMDVLDEWPNLDSFLDGASVADVATIRQHADDLKGEVARMVWRLRQFEWWLSGDHSSDTYAQMIRDGSIDDDYR